MIFLTIILTLTTTVMADVKMELGKKLAMEGNENGALACMTCHMENGEGMQDSGFPYLAGMNENYLIKQLKDFQSKSRYSDVMTPIAKGLNEEDRKSVAAYYASLPKINKVEKSTSVSRFSEGELIAERGIWSKGIPACFSCHGPDAVGVGEHFPPLINQSKLYLVNQLLEWQKGARKNDPAMLMKTIAMKLTKKEIEAVSEYLSSLPKVKTAEAK